VASISVVFVDNRYCARINWRYLRHRGGTDVLSFPLEEQGAPDGEIYVNLDRARDQATAYGVTEADEITRLVVHGMLHLMGYDDLSAQTRRRMKGREDAYLESLAPMRRRSKRA
jgi:rRNA maturation RNase YbeY